MYDFASLSDWLDGLDPKSRAAIVALCQEMAAQNAWTIGPGDVDGDPFELIGRLDALSATLTEEPGAIDALAGSEEDRDDLVRVLTYLEPMLRMRMSWDMARLRTTPKEGGPAATLLEIAINDARRDDPEVAAMRRFLRTVIGMVARTRLTLDLFEEGRMQRVERHLAGEAPDAPAAAPGEAGDKSAEERS